MEPGGAGGGGRGGAPWGFWATLGFSLLIGGVFFMAQAACVAALFVAIHIRRPDIDIRSLRANGLLSASSILAGMPPAVAASVLFAWLRGGPPLRDYFSLRAPGKGGFLRWFLVLMAYIACVDGLTVLLGRPVVPDFMVQMYRTARFYPLFWLAMVVAAPLCEETVVRGFMFRGIEESRLGAPGAVFLTSLGWAALHVQYDAYMMGTIFVAGLLLGIARSRTRSLYVPIMMHMAQNLAATLETVLKARALPL